MKLNITRTAPVREYTRYWQICQLAGIIYHIMEQTGEERGPPDRCPLCRIHYAWGKVAPMSFLAELHQLPAMSALSSDARRRFVLAYVTSGGDLAVTARERQMGEKAAASLLEQSDIRTAIVDVAYAYALRLQAIVHEIEPDGGAND